MKQHSNSVAQKYTGWFVKVISAISTVFGVTAALMILASVIITCQMIWVRFVLNESTIWQTEAVTYMMIGATLIGLPYVQLLRGHVSVDLVPMLLPKKLRKTLTFLVLLVSISVIGIMMFHGYELFYTALDRGWQSESIWGISLWIPYIALPLGFGLFALQMIADLMRLIMKHVGLEEDH